MTTEASLQTRARTPRPGDEVERICSFEAGYAALLTPHFDRLNEQSGELLVFVNGATFGGADLKWLGRLLREVRAEVQHYGDSWPVSLGWHLEPPDGAREMFATVEKAELLLKLKQIEAAAERAKLEAAWVRFNFWGGS